MDFLLPLMSLKPNQLHRKLHSRLAQQFANNLHVFTTFAYSQQVLIRKFKQHVWIGCQPLYAVAINNQVGFEGAN